MAEEDGIVLSDEYVSMIDGYMDTLVGIAEGYGLTLDQYLQIFYGDGCDGETFRGIMERYYLSSVYSEEYINKYEFTDDELYVPSVVHALFAPEDASQDSLAAAKSAAEDFLASCTSPEDVKTKGTELAQSGVVKECADYTVSKGVFVSEFEDWAYDPSRKEGDLGIVQTAYGYHVMGYYGLGEIDDSEKQNIALKALNDEVGSIAMSDVHEFYTNDTIEKPVQVAPAENTETSETSEPVISLPLDEEGNISLETTAGEEAQITAEPMKTPKSLSVTRKVTIALAAIVLVAIIVVAIVMVAKSRKQQDAVIKAAGKQKLPDDESEDDEE